MSQSTSKKAYPNFEQIQNFPSSHDMNKWLQAVKTIYYEERKNQLNRSAAVQRVTQGWNVTEINDFISWLRFYEEGTHLKYKTAQFWYGNADTGYLLPIKQDAPKESAQVDGSAIDFARDSTADELSFSEKKKIIEKQRNKIIGRLDSAEKLLRSQEGQLFADKDFAILLETIYELKKKIQMVNKKSTSSTLYEDMIIREANILTKKGLVKGANLLYSLAQAAPPPAPPPPAPPADPSGAPGGLPMPPPPPSQEASGIPTEVPADGVAKSKGIDKFLEALDDDNLDNNDSDDDTLEVLDVDDENLVVEAQVDPGQPAPPPPTPAPPIPAAKPSADLEVKEDEVVESPKSKDFDHMVNSIFADLTISDVVAKFEDIAKFYKTREMPRQLAMADMMLDSLGLATFFPALSEATNKALEANNYISTRLEDIISKLRGTMKTREIDIKNEEHKNSSPEAEKAKQILQEQDEKDAAKKKMRKEMEEESLNEESKETPEIDISEDLAPPPAAKPVVPPPPAPAAKPPVA